MNVDVDNFHQIRQQIKELRLIQRSKYISFDLQFTGVKFENNQRERSDMFLNQKYHKMAAVASKFNIIQIGITFILDDEKNVGKYIAYPYNFYVFPRESSHHDPVISLQSGCVQFNTNQNMDWNRWIKKGINFVKISQMDKIMNPDSRTFGQIIENFDELNQQIFANIKHHLNDIKAGQSISFDIPKFALYSIRRAVQKLSQEKDLKYQVNANYNDGQDESMAKLTIKMLNDSQYQQNQSKKLESLVGFTLIFSQIWMSNKKIIGHNCLYDVLFVYESFVSALPSEYNNFKELIKVNRQFYDTKYMTNQLQGKDKMFPKGTSLQEIFKFYYNTERQNKVLKLAPGFQSYSLQNQVLHEAGFDSYLTAWAFFQILPEIKLDKCQGKFNIFKSFYFMDIRGSDKVNTDLSVFVIAVAPYNKFIQLDELRKYKIQQSKKIKNLLTEEGVLKFMNVNDGLKQIFIYPKQSTYNEVLIKSLNKFKREKNIFGVRSLCEWLNYRNGSQNKINQS